jgi:hypothetical protein
VMEFWLSATGMPEAVVRSVMAAFFCGYMAIDVYRSIVMIY